MVLMAGCSFRAGAGVEGGGEGFVNSPSLFVGLLSLNTLLGLRL